MRKRRVPLFWLVALVGVLLTTPVAAAPQAEAVLQPGEPITLEQEIPVNIVFVGYKQETIVEEALLDQLPAAYEPAVRFPMFYGLDGRDMGLSFTYSYDLHYADAAFEDDFFSYLTRIGRSGDPSLFQQLYNEQEQNVLDVTGPVLYIDAPRAEHWLMRQGQSRLGIDPERSYTVYFVNWYGRDDFQFHLYEKTDDFDPDTGKVFGTDDDRKLIAWGGSHGRSWFYDLSAGPEAWTANFIVDITDLNEDEIEDYRMPPIWEYSEEGYRAPTALSSDLGLVTRYVAINLLFTSSPLYDPMVAKVGPGGRRIVDITLFEDDPNTQGGRYLDQQLVTRSLASFQPYYYWRTNERSQRPPDEGAARALRIFSGVLEADDCWNDFGLTFAQLFCYFDANRDQYLPAYRPNDYVAPVFAFNTTDEVANEALPLGFADDNWIDGTQSYIFAFDTPSNRAAGYGFTITIVHEVGHHIGLSHPHDGYDFEQDLNYGPGNEFFFAWSGSQSATIMSYVDVNFNFGRFDRDNMYRFETAGYLNLASQLLADIQAHPEQARVSGNMRRAERQAARALRHFNEWDYDNAVRSAYNAYLELARAAELLGIEEVSLLRAEGTPRYVPEKQVDWIRRTTIR